MFVLLSFRINKEDSVLYITNSSELSAWTKDEIFCTCTNGIGNCTYDNVMPCDRNEEDTLSPNRCKIISQQRQFLRHTQKIKPRIKKQFRVFQVLIQFPFLFYISYVSNEEIHGDIISLKRTFDISKFHLLLS